MPTSLNYSVCMHVALITQIHTCIMKKHTFKANHLMKQHYFSIPSQTALRGKNSHNLGANSFLKDKSQFLKRPKSMITTGCFSSLPLMCGMAMPCLEKVLNRGSYMSANVLLNLLNKLGKGDKMRGVQSILSLFRNDFNKFNNTRARMLDSIYHMTNTLKPDFWRKNVIILSLCAQRCYGRHNVSRKSINH